ncbi:MAG: hypothetical protein CMJ48_09900 [Planctomycetaceae bacterium]|nr:hypothetical protein [Planctomycetaceae bacterium]
MNCPNCGGRSFRIEVRFRGLVACEFQRGDQFEIVEPANLTSEWEDDSSCSCMDCVWDGTVGDARTK